MIGITHYYKIKLTGFIFGQKEMKKTGGKRKWQFALWQWIWMERF